MQAEPPALPSIAASVAEQLPVLAAVSVNFGNIRA
jgi:hypothetical protein